MPNDVPTFRELMKPTIQALKNLGGSASLGELHAKIIEVMNLSPEVAGEPHGDSNATEVEYRAGWTRTYLHTAGFIENSKRGVWALTVSGVEVQIGDAQQFIQEVLDRYAQAKKQAAEETDDASGGEVTEVAWQDEVIAVVREMDPSAFERLCQRILRESGFIEVEVTKRTGDGGIDGHGVFRIGGLISFTVLFQSKRYKNSVGPEIVRDFRGAMAGRADKGLIITTGRFTAEAKREATRDGAAPIDLIDGQLLAEKLKELDLGVETEMVENVVVKPDWFQSI